MKYRALLTASLILAFLMISAGVVQAGPVDVPVDMPRWMPHWVPHW